MGSEFLGRLVTRYSDRECAPGNDVRAQRRQHQLPRVLKHEPLSSRDAHSCRRIDSYTTGRDQSFCAGLIPELEPNVVLVVRRPSVPKMHLWYTARQEIQSIEREDVRAVELSDDAADSGVLTRCEPQVGEASRRMRKHSTPLVQWLSTRVIPVVPEHTKEFIIVAQPPLECFEPTMVSRARFLKSVKNGDDLDPPLVHELVAFSEELVRSLLEKRLDLTGGCRQRDCARLCRESRCRIRHQHQWSGENEQWSSVRTIPRGYASDARNRLQTRIQTRILQGETMPMNENSVYTQRFNMVMQPEERAMLQALAKERGLKESDVVRQWIRRDYADTFGTKRPGKPVPKYNSATGREKRKR
jgi:hypothetical protein